MNTRRLVLGNLFAVIFVTGIIGPGRAAKADVRYLAHKLLVEAQNASASGDFHGAYGLYESAVKEAIDAAVYDSTRSGTGGDFLGGVAALEELVNAKIFFGPLAATDAVYTAKTRLADLTSQLRSGTPYVFGMRDVLLPTLPGPAYWQAKSGTVYQIRQDGARICGMARGFGTEKDWTFEFQGTIVSCDGRLVTAEVKITGKKQVPNREPEIHSVSTTLQIDLCDSNVIRTGTGLVLRRIGK